MDHGTTKCRVGFADKDEPELCIPSVVGRLNKYKIRALTLLIIENH